MDPKDGEESCHSHHTQNGNGAGKGEANHDQLQGVFKPVSQVELLQLVVFNEGAQSFNELVFEPSETSSEPGYDYLTEMRVYHQENEGKEEFVYDYHIGLSIEVLVDKSDVEELSPEDLVEELNEGKPPELEVNQNHHQGSVHELSPHSH